MPTAFTQKGVGILAGSVVDGEEAESLLGTLYGTEHPWFWPVHIAALVSLGGQKPFCS